MKSIYIAGPMTGLPDFNYPAFREADNQLVMQGWKVFNPVTTPPPPDDMPAEKTWAYYMRAAIMLVAQADCIALLSGWENSPGAKLELHIARTLGMPVYLYADGKLSAEGNTEFFS